MPRQHEIQQQDSTRGAPLIAVRGLHETVAAGFGNAMLVVRTLDDVSLSVHRGDLVLVSGAPGAGAASLLATLAGTRRISQGSREVTPGARVRRAVVTPSARDAIVAGWMANEGAIEAPYRHGGVPTAYLLRVRPTSTLRPARDRRHFPQPSGLDTNAHCARKDSDERTDTKRRRENRESTDSTGSWSAWASALRREGGAIVLWDSVAGRRGVPATTAAMPSSRLPEVRVREHRKREGHVRLLTLVAGRIAGERIVGGDGR